MPSNPYSLVIPTSGRSGLLKEVFSSLEKQTQAPAEIVVVDAGLDAVAGQICEQYGNRLPIRRVEAVVASAATQRNQGAALASSPIIVFSDDDMAFGPDLMEQMCVTLSDPGDEVAGTAARIEGLGHPAPGRALWMYYRMLAGYSHPTYGARVIGPAINFLPCYERETEPLIDSDWLNSGLVAYRREIFMEEQFPAFTGYSYMEDLHLSYRISRRHRTCFMKDAMCVHLGEVSTATAITRTELVEMQWGNRVRTIRELMPMPRAKALLQLNLHRLFVLFFLRKNQLPGWREESRAIRALSFGRLYDEALSGEA